MKLKLLVVSVLLLLATPSFPEGSLNNEACYKIYAVRVMIGDAIELGAPTYNDGNHKGCYKIYRKTAKKILKLHGGDCPNVTIMLGAALAKAKIYDDTDTERAWTMRMAFDNILGVETQTR